GHLRGDPGTGPGRPGGDRLLPGHRRGPGQPPHPEGARPPRGPRLLGRRRASDAPGAGPPARRGRGRGRAFGFHARRGEPTAARAAPASPTPASTMSQTLSAPIIDVDGVDFSYGRLQVLFDVSLQVEQGEALALLGTNGAGKSTLLRLLCGLERPSSGSVTYEGRDSTGKPAERLVGDGLARLVGGRAA